MNRTLVAGLFCISMICCGTLSASAAPDTAAADTTKAKRAWEIGVGANGMHMTRFNIVGFTQNQAGGYSLDASKKDFIFGGQLYAACELTRHLYLDFQGEFDFARDRVAGGDKENHLTALAGVGLQWRLGEYFHSYYIDPFLRVGANYMYKNFQVSYNGMTNYDGKDMSWQFTNDYNKEGADRNHLFPISFGAGVNMWLNDRFGIGLEGDYMLMPHKDVANVWHGSLRLMWRFGGESKKKKSDSSAPVPVPAPVIQYVDRIVEKPVEKIVEVEKIVPVMDYNELFALFEGIYFVFDKSDITDESWPIIDRIAKIMCDNTDRKFLIVGCTDTRGSAEYNIGLSERRAKAVYDALIDKGVPADIIKHRGVGKKISYAPYEASDIVRKGDRKIFVEVVSNGDYWDTLK